MKTKEIQVSNPFAKLYYNPFNIERPRTNTVGSAEAIVHSTLYGGIRTGVRREQLL